jgi:hypothetical protein
VQHDRLAIEANDRLKDCWNNAHDLRPVSRRTRGGPVHETAWPRGAAPPDCTLVNVGSTSPPQ